MGTSNAGVVSSHPIRVTIKAPLVRKGNKPPHAMHLNLESIQYKPVLTSSERLASFV